MTRRELLAQAARGFPAIIVPKLAMAAKKPGGSRTKPVTGAQLIRNGSGAPNKMAFLFGEGAGGYAFDALGRYRLDLDIGMLWSSGTFGTALNAPVAGNATADFQTLAGREELTELNLPTTACTIAIQKTKLDTTNRANVAFGAGSATTATGLDANLPWSDGVVHWDFGTSRLSKSGLTIGTNDNIWVLIAGPKGMSIWQNGVKVNSTATAANARTNDASFMRLNAMTGVLTQDLCKFSFFYMWDYELTDVQARSVSAQPFQFFSGGVQAIQFFGPATGARRRTVIV